MKKTLLLCLALLLLTCFVCPASWAESADQKPDGSMIKLEVLIGGHLYNCTGTIQDLLDQGLSFVREGREAGRFHEVTNGRKSFHVALDAVDRDNATEADTYVCGFSLDAKDDKGAEIAGGLVLGEATRKDAVAVFGERDSSSSYYIRWYSGNVMMYFVFDGEGEDALLTRVQFTSSIPYDYGCEISPLAGTEEENLPDPKTFSFNQFILDGKFYDGSVTLQQLQDNGWRLSASQKDIELDAQGTKSFFISGTDAVLFNGKSFMHAFVYNSAEEGTCPLSEGTILQVSAYNWDGGTDMIVADGIHIGSSFDDVQATFGTNYTEKAYDAYTEYTYETGDVVNIIRVADGEVTGLTVRP